MLKGKNPRINSVSRDAIREVLCVVPQRFTPQEHHALMPRRCITPLDREASETQPSGDHVVGEIPDRNQLVLSGALATWFLVEGVIGMTSAV